MSPLLYAQFSPRYGWGALHFKIGNKILPEPRQSTDSDCVCHCYITSWHQWVRFKHNSNIGKYYVHAVLVYFELKDQRWL